MTRLGWRAIIIREEVYRKIQDLRSVEGKGLNEMISDVVDAYEKKETKALKP